MGVFCELCHTLSAERKKPNCIRIENLKGDKVTYIDGCHYEHRFLKNMAKLLFCERLVLVSIMGC